MSGRSAKRGSAAVRRVGALALVLACALPGCGGEAGANAPANKGGGKGPGGVKGDAPAAEPLAVSVTAIAPTAIERFYRTSGTMRALRSAELVALQPGVVLEL